MCLNLDRDGEFTVPIDIRCKRQIVKSFSNFDIITLSWKDHSMKHRLRNFVDSFPLVTAWHVADRGDGLQIWRVATNILN